MRTSHILLILFFATLTGGLAWAGWISQHTTNDALPCVPVLMAGMAGLSLMIGRRRRA